MEESDNEKNSESKNLVDTSNRNLIPLPTAGFPIVGIGASAGGLAAFEAFFSGLPSDSKPGMAFVLVQHLAPDHKSILAELVSRFSKIPVFEIEDGMLVEPNCIYTIPPNYDLTILNGTLHLMEPFTPRSQRLPIDFFFRSLAQDQRERAVGIVLSGTGCDGTQGIRSIKAESGIVFAQSPESAEFDGMPDSAIATGLVDFELPPSEMLSKLIEYVSIGFGTVSKLVDIREPRNENHLMKIFILLRSQTGHDFSQYKPNTIYRRIERRMALNHLESLDAYVTHLQQNPNEIDALFHDLLIGVTHFFRDKEAFLVFEEKTIPLLFANKSKTNGIIRVWVCGCSTGEEAYSIAILLQEYMDATRTNFTVQVFATDIDSKAISIARTGLYPTSISVDVSPERLSRFFTLEANGKGYRIRKGLRDMLVFSEQNVVKDPPFSKLDLISCRNLLIYFNVELQKKLIPLFHFSLHPGGVLFLGTSEGVGSFAHLFSALDRKAKFFQRRQDLSPTQRALEGQSQGQVTAVRPSLRQRVSSPPSAPKVPLREIMERALLSRIETAGAIVNAKGDILYLHGRTGMYLEPVAGVSTTNNIIRMAREGLRQDLMLALHQVSSNNLAVHSLGLLVKTNGHYTRVNMSVSSIVAEPDPPQESPTNRFFLILIDEATEQSDSASISVDAEEIERSLDVPQKTATESRIAQFREELRVKEEYLQNIHSELDNANEELKSSNEEMQSVNEELQSTNEELETSKEEMQSINEELSTVNAELQTKVLDLSRLNNDMNNLLAGSGIATVFVDQNLRILRFTPTVVQLINLIPSDVGRPVGHIVSNLVGYDSLISDAQSVLDNLVPLEKQVQTKVGAWFTMRIRPYRTLENVIEGVVFTFTDITEMKRVEESLEKANRLARLAVVVHDSNDAITVQDLHGRIIAWNPGAARIYGWNEVEALRMNTKDRIPEHLRNDCLAKMRDLSRAAIPQPYRSQRMTKSGTILEVWITATALFDESQQIYAIATTERAGSTLTEATQ